MNDTFTSSSHAEVLAATWTKNHTMLSPTKLPSKASTAGTGLSLTFRKLTLRSDSAVQLSGKHRLAAWWIETPLLQATEEWHLESHTEGTLLPPDEMWRFFIEIQQVTHREKSPTHHHRAQVLWWHVTFLWQSPEINGPLPSVETPVAFKKNSSSKMTSFTTTGEHRAQWKQSANC